MQGPSANQMPTLTYERRFWASGYRLVAGLDEAGRGALAGPVVAAAVILSPNGRHEALLAAGVRDSKQLTPLEREELFDLICEQAEGWGVGIVAAEEIDRLGIVAATRRAMGLALRQLSMPPEALLIDHLNLPDQPLPQQAISHGDQLSLSIAAASIIAKVSRDRMLVAYDSRYPGYGFARHKGYGTPAHRAALMRLGPCPLHRRSFRPVREALER